MEYGILSFVIAIVRDLLVDNLIVLSPIRLGWQ